MLPFGRVHGGRVDPLVDLLNLVHLRPRGAIRQDDAIGDDGPIVRSVAVVAAAGPELATCLLAPEDRHSPHSERSSGRGDRREEAGSGHDGDGHENGTEVEVTPADQAGCEKPPEHDGGWNADGTSSLEYTFHFDNQPGAHAIDFVDVGMPVSTFDMSTVSADACYRRLASGSTKRFIPQKRQVASSTKSIWFEVLPRNQSGWISSLTMWIKSRYARSQTR